MLPFGSMRVRSGCVTLTCRVSERVLLPTCQTVFYGLLALIALGDTSRLQADIVWEDHYSDEDVIVNGSSFTTSTGADVTFNTSVYSDSDGGTFDLSLTRSNSDYFTFEAGQTGAHTGYLELAMDNQNNDPADYLELTLTFDRAITNLQFSLLDVDSGSWDDGVELFYNGSNNARDSSSISVTTGSVNGIDNESYMHGWEGFGSGAASNSTDGNIDFDFGTLHVTSLRIRFLSTDDANSNPGGQFIGLSDMTFTNAVPEVASTWLMAVFGIVVLCGRWLSKRVWLAVPTSLFDHNQRLFLTSSPRAEPERTTRSSNSRTSRSAGEAATAPVAA